MSRKYPALSLILLLAAATTMLVSFIRASASLAWSAFCRVMDDISSKEDEVSSMEAACSEDPSARDWLEDDTWSAAEATCSAPSVNPSAALDMGLVIDLTA